MAHGAPSGLGKRCYGRQWPFEGFAVSPLLPHAAPMVLVRCQLGYLLLTTQHRWFRQVRRRLGREHILPSNLM